MNNYPRTGISALSKKIILFIILLSIVLTFLVSAVQMLIGYGNGIREIESVFSIVEKSYIPAIASSRFFLDDNQLKMLIDGLMIIPGISRAEVTDSLAGTEVTVYAAGKKLSSNRILREYPLIHEYNGTERHVGMLKISSDLDFLKTRLKRDALTGLFLNLLMIFAISFSILIIIQRFILRHLKRIAIYLNRTELTSMRQKALTIDRRIFLSKSPDELDDIVSSINHMYDRVITDYNTLKQAEQSLKTVIRDRETLLRELAHRTKNNMQVIISLLRLQSIKLGDGTEISQLVTGTVNRIQAMSLVHQMLYQTDNFSRVNIRTYIDELGRQIIQSYGNSSSDIILETRIDDINLGLDTAIPIGLVLVELLTNSISHAFSGRPEPSVSITLSEDSRHNITIVYEDNGNGFDADEQLKSNPDSLGLKLIFSIAEQQLYGRVVFEPSEGTRCIIGVPDPSANNTGIYDG